LVGHLKKQGTYMKTAFSIINIALYGILGATLDYFGLTGKQLAILLGIVALIHLNANIRSTLK
jgi:hypothetical protein